MIGGCTKKKRGSKWKKGCQHKNKYEVAIKKLIESKPLFFITLINEKRIQYYENGIDCKLSFQNKLSTGE